MKAMSPKEREEYKKNKLKLTGIYDSPTSDITLLPYAPPGRQIFERGNIVEEDTVDEEGVSVDVSQYDRKVAREEEVEMDRIHFSDSD